MKRIISLQIFILCFWGLNACDMNNHKDRVSKDLVVQVDSTIYFDCGKIHKTDNNLFEVKFDTIGEMRLSMEKESIKFKLDISGIKFKLLYEFTVNQYGAYMEISLELNQADADIYYLELIQVPKHAIIDRIYFRRVKEGFEIYKIEKEQYGSNNQICFLEVPDHPNIYLSELNSIGCIETKKIDLNPDRTATVLKDMGILKSTTIDSVRIFYDKIEMEVSKDEILGHFLFSKLEDINKIPSEKIKELVYGQYIKSDVLPMAAVFYDATGAPHYWNIHDEKSAIRIFDQKKDRSKVRANLIIFKVYTPLYNYDEIEVVDID